MWRLCLVEGIGKLGNPHRAPPAILTKLVPPNLRFQCAVAAFAKRAVD
jgi:hypothetical protein